MDYTVHGILQARLLEWGSLPLLQGIFPTQGSNPGLPHGRQIVYQLSHQGSHFLGLLVNLLIAVTKGNLQMRVARPWM